MTVLELIEQLGSYPLDAEVWVSTELSRCFEPAIKVIEDRGFVVVEAKRFWNIKIDKTYGGHK